MTQDQYLPVMLNCKGRLCLIIGGGEVAERKVTSLLNAGASIHIVSPVLHSGTLQRMANEHVLKWTQREYQADDLKGAFLVYAATDDRKLNLEIAANADELGVLVNIASDGEAGTFISPAVLHREDLLWLCLLRERAQGWRVISSTSWMSISDRSMRNTWIFYMRCVR